MTSSAFAMPSPELYILEAALSYAESGWRVIPLHNPVLLDDGHPRCSCRKPTCRSIGKHPRVKNWTELATTDEATIRGWWRQWPDANVGLATGEPAGFWVLDIDEPKTLSELEHKHGKLPLTVTAITGSGGEHRLFRSPFPTNNKVKIAPGLDVRTTGGLIVAPPSRHASGRVYEWDPFFGLGDVALAEAPAWLLELANGPAEVRDTVAQIPAKTHEGKRPAVVERARKYLAKMEPAVEGQGGHPQLFKAAEALVRGFDLDEGTAFDLLVSDYNPRCIPPWEPGEYAEIRRKVAEANEKGRMARGRLRDKPALELVELTPAGAPVESELDDRPSVRVSVELHETVDQAVAALRRDPTLYQRDGELVHVVRVAETEEESLSLVGTPAIRRVSMSTLRERLTRCASFERFDGRSNEYRACIPPEVVTNAVAARGEFPGVRPVVGVAEAPMLSADGSVVERPGYDRATRYVYMPNADFPPVQANPTQDDARKALAELAEVFCDFPYRSEADRMISIAAILTMLARPSIRGNVPAFIFDANTRGSGKTKQIDAVALIATGRGAAKMSYPGDDAELEKVLGAYALQGAAMIAFDNVVTSFGGGPLDRVLTAGDQVALRVLGRSELPSLPWRAVVFATGNNVSTIGDTSRRVLMCRLESPLERPEDREGFRHPNLLEWVERERPRLVAAALTILRAFIVAGRPQPGGKPWGSFEAWAELVPAAIVYAGGADPMECRVLDDAEDPEKAALLAIIAHWPRLAPEGMTARAAIAALYPAERLRGEPMPPDGFDELREAIEELVKTPFGKAPSPRALGTALGKLRGRYIAGLCLDSPPSGGAAARWLVRAGSLRSNGSIRSSATLRGQTVSEDPFLSVTNQAATAGNDRNDPLDHCPDHDGPREVEW